MAAHESSPGPQGPLSNEAQIELLHVVRGWRLLTSDLLVLQERGLTFAQLTARAERLRVRADMLTAEESVQALLEADEAE